MADEAVVELVAIADDWIRLSRRITGNFGHRPSGSAGQIGTDFVNQLLPCLATISAGKPAVQLALLRLHGFWGLRRGVGIDRELRILTWELWQPEKHPTAMTAVGKLVDEWAAEDPRTVMARLAGWSREATKAKAQLPTLSLALTLLGNRDPNVNAYIEEGLANGMSGELYSLMVRAVSGQTAAPSWLPGAFASPARGVALQAVLDSDGNAAATSAALAELKAEDAGTVEIALLRRSRNVHDPIAHELLTHPIDDIRGTAALSFRPGPRGQGPELPPEWEPEWSSAFEVAPLSSPRHLQNYRLGEHLNDLIARNPDLVESWFLRQIALDPMAPLYRLPDRTEAALASLPAPYRERIVRGTPEEARTHVLALLIDNTDHDWLAPLIDDGTIGADDVLHAAGRTDLPVPQRVEQLTSLGSVLVPRGIAPEAIAYDAMFGGWTGNESDNYEEVRHAFDELQPATDPNAEAVRLAGVELFAAKRDVARKDERLQRIRGDY